MTNWSNQQVKIFEYFGDSNAGNAVIRARAGTGKTTTVIEAISYVIGALKILFCAFNKRIADELSHKIKDARAEAKTLHSLGYAFIRRVWEKCRVDTNRGFRMAEKACGHGAPDEMVRMVAKLASRAKGMAPLAKSGSDLEDIAYEHDCIPSDDWSDDGWDVIRVCNVAYDAMVLAATTKDNTCDFDDMLYLPVRNGWVRPWYDLVIVDECQDMNAAQLIIAKGACKKTGRIVCVGDDRQAIYGFRGADSGSLDRMKAELSAVEFPLTITYRCPKTVVSLAATIVPDYQAADTAPEGMVSRLALEKLAETAQPGEFVISRKNAPLAGICLRFLKLGKKAKIEGKDIGAGLCALVRKLGKSRNSLPEFLSKLDAWEIRETTRAQAAGEKGQSRIAYVADQADTLRAMAEGLSGIKELIARIETLFTDNNHANSIVCSTVHKAKGLEADRVYVLENTLIRGKGIEESNIEYVAITRAKRELTWIE